MILYFENLQGVKIQVESSVVNFIEPVSAAETKLIIGEGNLPVSVRGDADTVGRTLAAVAGQDGGPKV